MTIAINLRIFNKLNELGVPTVELGGAVLETLHGLDHAAPTGLFFDQQTPSAVVAAVQWFEAEQHRITACRDNALRFAPERFRAEFTAFVERHRQAFQIQIHNPKGL